MTLSMIERSLLARYFGSSDGGADMSSHWRDYSGQFAVSVDPQGHLAARGVGFGHCRWQGPVHRLFDAVTRHAHLIHLPQRRQVRSVYRDAVAVAGRMGLDPTLDVFRQACTVAVLERHWHPPAPRRYLLIGDGYGVLGALLKRRTPSAQIVYVDLGRTLLFQAHHVRRAYSDAAHALIEGPDMPWPDADFVYCPSEHADAVLAAEFDLAINIASMQEMTANSVAHYFRLMRQCLRPGGLFYCCNRERKVMTGGEVSEFARYPWLPADRVLFDERCPWHQYFFAARGVTRVMGVPLPFLQTYDGPHRHRLTVLTPAHQTP